MSTTVTTSSEHAGDVETVLALLTSERWVQHKAEQLADGSRVVRREEQPGGGIVLVVSRELPGGGPGFLDRFLPKDGRVLQTQAWGPASDGVRRGSWTVEIPGAPASVGGTVRLEPRPAGSCYAVEGEVTVRVPLVGGKAERVVADLLVKLAAKEAGLLEDALRS